MTRSGKTLVCVLGSLALCTATQGMTTTDNPYAALTDRNVFGLKPPPPPPDPSADVKKEPPPNIFLTGITTIFGNKRALIKTVPKTVKPGDPKELDYILTEGQRDGDVEVVSIDEKAGKVVIKLEGNEMTLDFEKNAPKIVAAPIPAPAPPGMPGAIPTPIRTITPNAPPSSPLVNPFMNKSIPSRTLRLPGSGGASASPVPNQTLASAGNYGGAYANPGSAVAVQTPGGTLPVGSLMSSPSNPGKFQSWPPPRSFTPEEQAIFDAAQAQAHPDWPVPPGTPGVPESNPVQPNQQQQQPVLPQ